MRNSLLTIILSALIVGSSTFLLITKKANNRLTNSLILSKSKADSLGLKNESIRKEIRQVKSRSDSVTQKNEEISRALTKANAIISYQDAHIANLKKSFEKLNSEADELLTKQTERNKQLQEIQTANARLLADNKQLNTKIAALNSLYEQMSANLKKAQLLEKDNIICVSMDKNFQPNAKAKRVKKIMATLSLPIEIKSPAFKMFDPNGTLLTDEIGKFSFHTETDSNSLGGKSTKLEITYLTAKKIKAGSYRLEMMTDSTHIGNLLMSFR